MSKKPKSLVLFSGGLDSQLAAKILKSAGLEVTLLAFSTPFFGIEKAVATAEKLGFPIVTRDISDTHLAVVKNPPHGRGKNMNPCIDCHALMLRLAAEIAADREIEIIATGEVVGQRPFSQTKNSLRCVEKSAGLVDRVLRPLSAKILWETEFEKSGLVDREKMFDLEGRGRTRQLELAREFGIEEFPTPAGGCLLTDPGFSERFRKQLERDPELDSLDSELLKTGRYFPVGEKSFAMIGREKFENETLRRLASDKIFVVKMSVPGPVAAVRIHEPDDFEEIFPTLAEKIKSYSRVAREGKEKIVFQIWGAREEILSC